MMKVELWSSQVKELALNRDVPEELRDLFISALKFREPEVKIVIVEDEA